MRSRPGDARAPTSLVTELAAVAVAAAAAASVAVLLAASFGALIFSGPLASHVGAGIALGLFTIAIVAAVSALASSFPGTIAGAQDNTALVAAVMAGSIAASAGPEVSSDALFATVVVAIAVGSVLTGVVFLTAGQLRLGGLSRYVPYPVIGGFLAGTGWLLVVGSFEILTEAVPGPIRPGALLNPDVWPRWAPAAAFAVALLVAIRRSRNILIVPGALLAGIALFYAVVAGLGASVVEAQAAGWLLGPFPAAAWRPISPSMVAVADWGLVVAQAGTIATLALIATMSLLLNTSGVEIVTGADLDIDRELRAAGLANLLAGAGGGLVGYSWASVTGLAHRLGAARRVTGLLVAGACAAVLLVGIDVVGFVPVPLVGALLMFLGLTFLSDWLLDGWRTLPRSDYAVVALIVVAIAAAGLLPGVAFGIALALLMFVVRYSRTDVVKHALDGATFRSNVDRPPHQRRALSQSGGRTLILELQGFVFFGTANSVLRLVERRLQGPSPLDYLVVDFRRVSGIDSSATFSLVKLRRLLANRQAQLVLTAVPDHVLSQLDRAELTSSSEHGPHVFVDLDRGVEWCEDQLVIASQGLDDDAPGDADPRCTAAEVLGVAPDRLEPFLQRRSLPAGEVLIEQGGAPRGLIIVESGRVTAVLAGDGGSSIRLRTMRAGTIIGELSYFLGRPATAQVITETPADVADLPAESLAQIECDDPELAAAIHRALITMLGERLVATDRLARMLMD